MDKQTSRNALMVIGLLALSRVIASIFTALFIVVTNRLTFMGDIGTVTMWLWEGFPGALVAFFAAITLVWIVETGKPSAWVGVLAALYLYVGCLNAWRLLHHGWRIPPHTPDYIGILAQGIIPAFVCLVVGTWRTKRLARAQQANF